MCVANLVLIPKRIAFIADVAISLVCLELLALAVNANVPPTRSSVAVLALTPPKTPKTVGAAAACVLAESNASKVSAFLRNGHDKRMSSLSSI